MMKRAIIILLLIPLASAIDTNECGIIYKGITENYTDNTLISILNISNETITYYKENWVELCQNATNKSLTPNKICKEIYNTILNNGYNKEIIFSLDYPRNLIENYYFNYPLECNNISNELPERKYEILYINHTNNYCELKNIFMGSFPFKDFYIGNVSCENAKKINLFLELTKESDYYKVIKIRLWWILSLILLVFSIFAIKSNFWLNNELEKFKR